MMRKTRALLILLAILYILVFGLTLTLHQIRVFEKDSATSSGQLSSFGLRDDDDDNKWWMGKIQSEGGLLKHPYMGARHSNGSVGMLVNPSPSRLRVVDITKVSKLVCSSVLERGSTEETSFYYGIEGKGGRQVLEKVKVKIDPKHKSVQEEKKRTNARGERRSSRILCLVYSVHLPPNGKNDHIANHANLKAIAQTWGQKCDGFIGASNVTDHSIGAVNLLHEGPEEYGNMWQKG
jgi:hypothetical protein